MADLKRTRAWTCLHRFLHGTRALFTRSSSGDYCTVHCTNDYLPPSSLSVLVRGTLVLGVVGVGNDDDDDGMYLTVCLPVVDVIS